MPLTKEKVQEGKGTEREKMDDSLYQLIQTCLSEEVALGLLWNERGAIAFQFVEKKKSHQGNLITNFFFLISTFETLMHQYVVLRPIHGK